MKLLRYADYKFSFDFNFSQRQKHMYICLFIKRTSCQLFIMHWLSRSGLQFAHTLNQCCSHHGFPALGQMVLALGFIEVVTCYPLRFGQGESINNHQLMLSQTTNKIYDSSKYSDSDCPSPLFSRPQIPHCIATWENQGRVLSGITKSELEGGEGFCLL